MVQWLGIRFYRINGFFFYVNLVVMEILKNFNDKLYKYGLTEIEYNKRKTLII